ncbi:cytochrome c oxidase family protein-like protein [Microthyrium microscopicum]|uniref:Cytochrome c oxidase subunit 9, mitochondrial n=1 Tax=Microthyrium microscopicum TaxID=703497 RepID=A0A6A6UT75_9PEZI|nr:cytochrome c oxidase family protein-like protein [Microthyrium microscopicum]
MAVAPITGMLRRRIILDLSIAGGLGVVGASYWWYAYHVPNVRHRDAFYIKIEKDRADRLKALADS